MVTGGEREMAEKNRLSLRERRCLEMVARGLRIQAIADEIVIARVTVEMHLKSAREKLDAATLPQAVAKAIETKEIDPYG